MACVCAKDGPRAGVLAGGRAAATMQASRTEGASRLALPDELHTMEVVAVIAVGLDHLAPAATTPRLHVMSGCETAGVGDRAALALWVKGAAAHTRQVAPRALPSRAHARVGRQAGAGGDQVIVDGGGEKARVVDELRRPPHEGQELVVVEAPAAVRTGRLQPVRQLSQAAARHLALLWPAPSLYLSGV
jgi:hypothetical protein